MAQYLVATPRTVNVSRKRWTLKWLIPPFVGATFTPGARFADVGLERPLAIWEVRCAGQLLNKFQKTSE